MIWLLAFQLALSPASHAVSSDRHYENAREDFAQRKFSEAVSEVNTALHESPYMVPALVLKARLSLFAHRADVAKSCLITAITAEPTSEEAQFYLGVVYYNQNEFRSAISPLLTAQTLSPKSPLPVFYLAMAHEALGETAQALDLYEQAESLSSEKSPQRGLLLLAYARFLLAQGRTQDGIEKIRESVQDDPGSREAHFELAMQLEQNEDFKAAAVEAELALTLPDLGTTDAQLHYLLSRIYRKLNQPDLAKAHFEKFKAASKTTASVSQSPL